MNELTRRCLELPFNERQKLINVLKESLDGEDDDGSRFAILYKAATEVCGNGILSKSKDFNLVMGRRMIAYQMRLEGYTYMSIGKKLIRHHASIIHLVKMMEDVIKYQFGLEMGYWTLFQRKIKEYDIHDRSNQGS